MAKSIFVTVINCMDGRAQYPAWQYLTNKYGVDYVDSITEPGPIKFLSENKDQATVDSIKRRVEISLVEHGSRHLAVVGHFDCAGNPVGKDEQIKQIKGSIEIIKSWGMEWEEIIGLWIDENSEVVEVTD